jgi:hypothetical protein
LGNDARGADVALENLAIHRERCDAFLNTSATRVIQSDERNTRLHGEILNLYNFLTDNFAQRTTINKKILRIDGDGATINGGITGYNAVTVRAILIHAKVSRAMASEGVELDKRTGINELCDALACGPFTL